VTDRIVGNIAGSSSADHCEERDRQTALTQVDSFLSPERKAKCLEKRERDLFALFDVAKVREMRD